MMHNSDFDLIVIGAGFGGSLLALCAQRLGRRTLLLEKGSHPRFAIGESSTPLADLALESICDRYDLPTIRPLCRYGSWRQQHPELLCGLKRGFSYFHHELGTPFNPDPGHANEMLVAANPDEEHSDTHWYRSDVDHFFLQQAMAGGVAYIDNVTHLALERETPWQLTVQHRGEQRTVEAPLLIDASGGGGALATLLDIGRDIDSFHTNSRTVYAHFDHVQPWQSVFSERGGRTNDHPFPCDQAALHHVFDGGWMWQLRFANDRVSAGFVLDCKRFPEDPTLTPEAEWQQWLDRFPSIAQQFHKATALTPITRTGRLQRQSALAAGPGWAMLPYTAGFVDPFFSAGIAHTLSGVERLAQLLENGQPTESALSHYGNTLTKEIRLIDTLVHGSYACFQPFALMDTFPMLYFGAAIASEHARRDHPATIPTSFLLADDKDFVKAVDQLHNQVTIRAPYDNAFQLQVRAALPGTNPAGLCDLTKQHMYPFG